MRKPAAPTPDWSTAGVLQRVNGHRLVNRAEEGRTRWEQERTRYGRAGTEKSRAVQVTTHMAQHSTKGQGRAGQDRREGIEQIKEEGRTQYCMAG